MTDVALQGSLHSFKLPDVLTFLNTTRKTGTLTLASDGRESYVFFDNGSLIYAGSNQSDFRLSNILLRKKRITKNQYETIDQLMAREGGRFGQIAVEQKLFSEAQLHDFLKVQVSEIIYDCFVWKEGSFTFADQMKLPNYAVTISIDLSNLIMEGARRIEEWEECVRLLPDKAVVFRVVNNPNKEEKISLSLDEWKILFLINGQRTLEDLCHDAEGDPFHIYRVVYGLQANKLIEVAPPEVEPEDPGDRTRLTTGSGEETVRQAPANFGAEPTIEEDPIDDTSLLIHEDAKLSLKDVVKPTVGQLTVLRGPGEGTSIPLTEQEYLIGRQRENQIQIPDLGVSGYHARLYRGPDGYVIEDLKSRNGTWVNNSRISNLVLSDGDELRMGSTEMRFTILYGG